FRSPIILPGKRIIVGAFRGAPSATRCRSRVGVAVTARRSVTISMPVWPSVPAAARGRSRVAGDGLRARLSGVSPTQQDDCQERVGEPSQNGELVMTKPSAAHDALKIDASGHVGIGTPNPDPNVLLDVNGPAKVPTLIFPDLL